MYHIGKRERERELTERDIEGVVMATNGASTHLPGHSRQTMDVPVVCGGSLAVGIQVVDVDNDEGAPCFHVVIAILYLTEEGQSGTYNDIWAVSSFSKERERERES